MNYSMVFYILGYILKFESAFLMLPVLVGLIYAENDVIPYLLTAALCLLLGIVFTRRKPASPSLYTREGFVTVALSWIAMKYSWCTSLRVVGRYSFLYRCII